MDGCSPPSNTIWSRLKDSTGHLMCIYSGVFPHFFPSYPKLFKKEINQHCLQTDLPFYRFIMFPSKFMAWDCFVGERRIYRMLNLTREKLFLLEELLSIDLISVRLGVLCLAIFYHMEDDFTISWNDLSSQRSQWDLWIHCIKEKLSSPYVWTVLSDIGCWQRCRYMEMKVEVEMEVGLEIEVEMWWR